MRMTTKRKGRKPETVKVGNVRVKVYRRQKTVTSKLKSGKVVTKDYTVYEVADYTSGTRRLCAFANHAAALAKAETLARQISTGQTTAAAMTNPEAASYGRAIELLRPTGVSLEIATAVFAKCFTLLGGDAMVEAAQFYKRHRADAITHKPVAEVVTELIETKTARGASGPYIQDLRSRLSRFAQAFAVDIGNVTTGDVQHWLDGLKCAPTTAKNFRRVLHTLFGFAESRGYVFKGGNPVDDVEHIDAPGGAIEIFTPAEIDALLKAATKEFRPVVAIGAFAGLRSAEAMRLDWKDIDLTGGFIHLGAEKAKTAQRRLVPILPNLAAWLAGYAGQRGRVYKGNRHDLLDARAATVQAAGVPWKPNALRHSFVSYRLAAIQNAAQVALEAGNSPAVVFKHYRELVRPEAAKTWFAIAPEQPENVVSMGKAAL